MSEFKGTPGPWFAEGDSDMGLWVTPEDRSAPVICDMIARLSIEDLEKKEFTQSFQDEDNANAELIAAAPDLLEAAIYFINKVETGKARSTNSYNKFKKAVNKALNIQS